MKALDVQVGGDHYKTMQIQPVEFIAANGIGFLEGSAIKYLCRHRAKSGRQDLEKAKHYIDLMLELYYPLKAYKGAEIPSVLSVPPPENADGLAKALHAISTGVPVPQSDFAVQSRPADRVVRGYEEPRFDQPRCEPTPKASKR